MEGQPQNPENFHPCIYLTGLQIRVHNCYFFFLFLDQTYIVGTQKNQLSETVLLSTETHVLTDEYENKYHFIPKLFVHLGLWYFHG